jgi:hypothetical protein
MQTAWEAVRAAFDQHAITQRLAPHVLAEWKAWALQRTKAFQRTSSAGLFAMFEASTSH